MTRYYTDIDVRKVSRAVPFFKAAMDRQGYSRLGSSRRSIFEENEWLKPNGEKVLVKADILNGGKDLRVTFRSGASREEVRSFRERMNDLLQAVRGKI